MASAGVILEMACMCLAGKPSSFVVQSDAANTFIPAALQPHTPLPSSPLPPPPLEYWQSQHKPQSRHVGCFEATSGTLLSCASCLIARLCVLFMPMLHSRVSCKVCTCLVMHAVYGLRLCLTAVMSCVCMPAARDHACRQHTGMHVFWQLIDLPMIGSIMHSKLQDCQRQLTISTTRCTPRSYVTCMSVDLNALCCVSLEGVFNLHYRQAACGNADTFPLPLLQADNIGRWLARGHGSWPHHSCGRLQLQHCTARRNA